MVAEILALIAPAVGPITEFAILGIKKCWKSYREKTKATRSAEPRISNKLQEVESNIEEICSILASKLGDNFTKGDKRAYIDLRRINNEIYFPRIQVDIFQTLSRPDSNTEQIQKIEVEIEKAGKLLVETLLELSKRQSPDLGFWVWQILMPLMTIPSLRDYLQPFAAQALHAHTPAQISPHRDLRGKEILDSLQQHGSAVVPTVRPRQLCEGPYNYCKGSIALQKQPSQGIESIALKVKSESAYRLPNYRCTLCYLDLEDNGLEPWSSIQWACLGMSHIMATISTSRMVACFKCVECHYRSKSVVYASPKLMMSHIQDHVSAKPISGTKAYYKDLLQSKIEDVEDFEIQMKRLHDQIDRVEKELDEAAKEILSQISESHDKNPTASAEEFVSVHSWSRQVSPVSSDDEQRPASGAFSGVSNTQSRQVEATASEGTTPTGSDHTQKDLHHPQLSLPIPTVGSIELPCYDGDEHLPKQQVVGQDKPPALPPKFDNTVISRASRDLDRSVQQSPQPVELLAETEQAPVPTKPHLPKPRRPPPPIPELPAPSAKSPYPSILTPGHVIAQEGPPNPIS